jgi:hypothetical protein
MAVHCNPNGRMSAMVQRAKRIQVCVSYYSQIHVAIVGFYPTQQFVVISNIDQDLCIATDRIVQDAKGSGFEICNGGFWLVLAHRFERVCWIFWGDWKSVGCLSLGTLCMGE